VEPQLLHLLAREDAQYGYDLLAHLREGKLTDSEIDVGVVYRTLRTLEEAGCVVSHWEPGPGGPNRRMYEITPVGRRHLRDWATVLHRQGTAMVELAEDCNQIA
jgi:DNA-binding PadR family transcriptional regulator